ncbi:tripartite tricarboxylate transporter TctB family protein [Roseitranquillus sediminis]|uniref:tripartite tricarboxylate transporter TctB family protein n=1 Tax=Roseitranquillus sediminis TaxID=2809051 RepID=UPI001D0C0169|nr:tripartite tricarboxylate transporter TctB family protein [Roseitranquillus sediminis]MBM9595419.1 tripartite tricarboxylate transporter TctB family protein [Roseitranquillus sediminis]
MLARFRRNPLETIVLVVLLVLGIAGWMMSQNFRGDAGTWPGVIMIMMSVGALLVLGAQFLGPVDETAETPAATEMSGKVRIAINVAILVVYILAVTSVGLYASTAIYLFGHMLYLGIRPVWLAIATSVAVAAVLWMFFGYVLGISISNTLLF